MPQRLRSASAIGISLMEAKRRCITPAASKEGSTLERQRREQDRGLGTEDGLGVRLDQSECHHSFQSAEEDGAHSVTGQV